MRKQKRSYKKFKTVYRQFQQVKPLDMMDNIKTLKRKQRIMPNNIKGYIAHHNQTYKKIILTSDMNHSIISSIIYFIAKILQSMSMITFSTPLV